MAVAYFVRMVAEEGQADNVLDLLLVHPRRIEDGEQGNIIFGVHRSLNNPNEFWLYPRLAQREVTSSQLA